MRRAINYCLNRDGLVTLLNGLAEPAVGAFKKTDLQFGKPKENYAYDPAKAMALLKEAGFGPKQLVKAKVMISTSGSGQMLPLPMNEFLQQNLKECSFDISFEVVEWGTMLVALRNAPTAQQALGSDAMNISLPPSTDISQIALVLPVHQCRAEGPQLGELEQRGIRQADRPHRELERQGRDPQGYAARARDNRR